MNKALLFFAWGILLTSVSKSQTIAFPGAEGFGAIATGGRGGELYRVVNLNDSGPGSFRDAVSKPNRTVIFDIGGIVSIKEKVKVESNITIAGQTAPGCGITIYGNGVSFTNAKNVIVRYVRFRGSINMPRGACSLSADYSSDIIFDHCSISWGRWDNLHIKESENITLQYCIIGEAIDPQRFGALLENPTRLTIHHCLWISNTSRNPKAKAGIQFANNVIYNWGKTGFVGGHSKEDHYQDIIGNYFIAGPNTHGNFAGMFSETDHVYQTGNYVDTLKDGVLNGTLVSNSDLQEMKALIADSVQNPSPIPLEIETAEAAVHKVIQEVGASIYRDSEDLRMIDHLKSLGLKGEIINTERITPVNCAEINPIKDSDNDGIPDSWELKKQLNPNDPKDANRLIGSYSFLEEYLNSIPTK